MNFLLKNPTLLVSKSNFTFKILVSLESLQGINILTPFSDDSTKPFIQFPNANNDLFIFPPSISLNPVFFVDEERSDPAKSTKTNLPTTVFGSKLSLLSLLSTLICKIP